MSLSRVLLSRFARATATLLMLVTVIASLSCTYPPTEVIVCLATDAPDDRMLTIRASVRRLEATSPPSAAAAVVWISGGSFGTIHLPAAFAVLPSRDGPRDERVELEIDVAIALADGAPTQWFRRTARFRFIPRLRQVLPMLLSVHCVERATGCATVGPGACTPAILCSERGLTCGAGGACEDPEVTLIPADRDAQMPEGIDAVVSDAADGAIVDDLVATSDGSPDSGGCAAGQHRCPGTMTCAPDDSTSACGPDCVRCPAVPNAQTVCTDGVCGFTCAGFRADCDGIASNGCEGNLADPANCGACLDRCAAPTPWCVYGAGTFACQSNCSATDCNGSCVDTQTSPDHCGNCTTTCPSVLHGSATCSAGACGFRCDSGYHACGSICVADDDASYCGTSCIRCTAPAGGHCTPSCAAGSCQCPCDPGYADCDGSTANGCETAIGSDAHCNGCAPCGPGSACQFYDGIGRCVSSTSTCDLPGTALCAGSCVDLGSDAMNCGGCGRVCMGTGLQCVGGVCAVTCNLPGYHLCSGTCVVEDPDSCGPSCENCHVPYANRYCTNHVCEYDCDRGRHLCAPAPGRDRPTCELDADPLHCGAACIPCPTSPHGTTTCVGGVCGLTCASGYHLCGVTCVDNTSPASCGPTSCTPCPSPTIPNAVATCDGSGHCGSQCRAGYAACGGGCFDLATTNAHCGSCDVSCGPRSSGCECQASACVCP